MALVKCPECGADVSPRAVACPRCGDPLEPTVVSGRPVQTIEATGKKWKAMQLVGVLVAILGFTLMATMVDDDAGRTAGIQLSVLGLFVFLAARTGAWWHHG